MSTIVQDEFPCYCGSFFWLALVQFVVLAYGQMETVEVELVVVPFEDVFPSRNPSLLFRQETRNCDLLGPLSCLLADGFVASFGDVLFLCVDPKFFFSCVVFFFSFACSFKDEFPFRHGSWWRNWRTHFPRYVHGLFFFVYSLFFCYLERCAPLQHLRATFVFVKVSFVNVNLFLLSLCFLLCWVWMLTHILNILAPSVQLFLVEFFCV